MFEVESVSECPLSECVPFDVLVPLLVVSDFDVPLVVLSDMALLFVSLEPLDVFSVIVDPDLTSVVVPVFVVVLLPDDSSVVELWFVPLLSSVLTDLSLPSVVVVPENKEKVSKAVAAAKKQGYVINNLPKNPKELMEALINDPEALQGSPELSIAHKMSV